MLCQLRIILKLPMNRFNEEFLVLWGISVSPVYAADNPCRGCRRPRRRIRKFDVSLRRKQLEVKSGLMCCYAIDSASL